VEEKVKVKFGRSLAIAITISAGLLVLANFFVRNDFLRQVHLTLLDWAIILAAVALVLGALNVVATHVRKIRDRRSGWVYSLFLLAALGTVIVLGLVDSRGPASPSVSWIFQNVQIPLQATILALLAFFVASAAYRAFRVRSVDSFILLVVGLIVLLGQVPLGQALWDRIASAKDWILSYPSTGGARGIIIGAALGAVLTGLRVLLGIDRPHVK
jgi:hypothetical protein